MALTRVFPESADVSYIVAEGPFKREIFVVTSDATDDDTINSKLQRPVAVSIKVANSDLGGSADGASVTFSGKVITVRDPAAVTYVIEVLGF